MAITSLRGSTLPNKSFAAGRAKTRDVVRIAPDTATTFANGASISAGGVSSVTISNVSVTDSGYIVSNATPYIDSTGGFIKITGTGFAVGCTVYVGGNAASSTTFISSTEVRAQVGAASSNAQAVYVVNTDNSVGILLNAITYSGTPSWSTGATLTSQIADISFSIALSATSDSAIVYTVASGSSTPAGTTLYSNGVFAGTVTGISNDTNYSFTVLATDIENQLSARAFTVTVSAGDQYFNITPLLLNGDANVWVRDSSVNSLVPTINGTTIKPSAFSPYNTSWSAYFDGNGDYLSIAHNAALNLSTGNFTIEAWVYWNGVNASSALLSKDGVSGSSYPSYSMGIASSKLTIYLGSGNGVSSLQTIPSTIVLPANQWVHIAVVKSSTVVTMFHNGANVAAAVQTATITDGSKALLIGYETGQPTSSYWSGYISNARIVKGLAVYTGNFTPQTSSLSSTQSSSTNVAAISSETSLLTLQNNQFKDNSTNAFAVTRTGDVAIRSFGPFVETDTTTGSSYFLTASADHLIYATTTALGLSNGNWTIDFWVYPTTTTRQDWVDINGSGTRLLIYYNGTAITVFGNSIGLVTGSAIAQFLNQWNHILVSNLSGFTRLWVNGTQQGSTYTNSQNYGSTNGLSVGKDSIGSANMSGHIADLRIIKGSGVSTPTVPTAPLTAITNTSLLTLQYRRGENNHRFIDESGVQALTTRTGNPSQGSFSPFSPAGWSNYFDGSSYYDFTASTTFNEFLTGDFTVECWLYYTGTDSFSGSPTALSVVATWSTAVSYEIEVQSGGVVRFAAGNNIPIDLRSSGAGLITANAWYHVAAARASGVTRLFINGANVAAHSGSVSISQAATNMRIAGFPGGGNRWTGYVSDLRIVKGQAAYTANFTPATSSLSTTSQSITSANVFLGCNTNRFIDANTTPKTISSFTSAPKIQAFSPFRPSGAYSPTLHGGSAYFDGSGDYVYIANNAVMTLGTNDHCIELWMYPNGAQNQYTTVWYYSIGAASGATNTYYFSIGSDAGGSISVLGGPLSGVWAVTLGGLGSTEYTAVLNNWTHVVLTRRGSAYRLFLNGVLKAYTTYAGSIIAQGGSFSIGWDGSNATTYYKGWISGFRVVNGNIPVAYQTASTTLGTTIFTPPTSVPAFEANTAMAMSFTNGGIVDATGRITFETLADTKISNVASKFGSGSLYFDGTGDYVVAPSNPAFGFGTGDFTIECWIYFNSTSGTFVPFAQSDALGSSTNDKWFFALGSSTLRLQTHSSGGFTCTTPWTPSTGIWYHIAAVRSSGTILLFINGTSGTVTTTGTPSGYSLSQNGLSIGAMSTPYHLNGYIDDFRITKFARYTSAFTAPTTAHLTK